MRKEEMRMNRESLEAALQPLLDEITSSSEAYGLQAAAYLNGRLVLSVCSGTADSLSGRKVAPDTLFIGQSASKGIVATLIHRLVQAGMLAYDDPVSAYWPEFAAHGKDKITIRQVLTHSAGIPQMPEGAGMETLCDWEAMTRGIEGLSPLWDPGTKSGYHGLTFGWILGETAARAAGTPFTRLVEEEICRPLGIEGRLYFGAPPEAEPRIARISGDVQQLVSLPEELLLKRVLPVSVMPVHNPEWNEPLFHRAGVPAVGAVMTAEALARMYASLIGEGVDGVRLLSLERTEEATRLQHHQDDEVMGGRHPMALGYALGDPEQPSAMGSGSDAFGHAGMGGIIGFADPSAGLAVAVLTNRLGGEQGDGKADVRIAAKIRELLQLGR
ncbi:beta-lactamase [Paenibacillus mucilaginosus 3016]|uniref:Beta-lactamase n=2 Tax=Paenibacillus mucilaginosus TaxID=61624 RepID=H6NP23_9BACL|nr:beta-lactamase [Paenibacillus mucilaginosus 3016]WFA19680.1 EstA family serine hydrolase [Paenibacillus mucilaginosus]